MKNMISLGLLIWACYCFVACSTSKNQDPDIQSKSLLERGRFIASSAQNSLLGQVANAIDQDGVSHAVEFCHAKAEELTDSLSIDYQAQIVRLTNKHRNPHNQLVNQKDKEIWELFASENISDTLLRSKKSAVYYKAIKIGMPTCLKCHGKETTDITPETLAVIRAKYPQDQATGYQMGDLRGMWKISLGE